MGGNVFVLFVEDIYISFLFSSSHFPFGFIPESFKNSK